MFTVYSVDQMREAETRAAEGYGISLATLMDKAGAGLAKTAGEMLPAGRNGQTNTVWVFCGTGNNGGDGYVCATELRRQGITVVVCAVAPKKLAPGSLVRAAADRYVESGGKVTVATIDLKPRTIKADLIVDALLGTGLSRPVEGSLARLIEIINATPVPVLACDVPSGVDAEYGEIMGVAVQADRTLMMGLAKPAVIVPPGAACFGKASVCDIGLPPALVESMEPLAIGMAR